MPELFNIIDEKTTNNLAINPSCHFSVSTTKGTRPFCHAPLGSADLDETVEYIAQFHT